MTGDGEAVRLRYKGLRLKVRHDGRVTVTMSLTGCSTVHLAAGRATVNGSVMTAGRLTVDRRSISARQPMTSLSSL